MTVEGIPQRPVSPPALSHCFVSPEHDLQLQKVEANVQRNDIEHREDMYLALITEAMN